MRSKIIATLTAGTILSLAGVLAPVAAAKTPVVPGVVGESCSAEGQRGQELKITGSTFEVEGTATVANFNDTDLPLTQTIKEGKTKTWNIGGSIDFDLLELFHVTFNSGYSDTQTWEVGQTIGPYQVKPGYTGVLEYGFLNQDFEGTHIRCQGGQWVDEGRPFHGDIPKERHVKVSMRENGAH